MEDIKERYRRFKEWEQQPHQVAPLSEDEHECATCGTRFEGNYCPRCGQSARIGRYSFKKAFLLFLDVWGVGNRGMFRTLRDLILRPGYMIRDYLRGMQMAYFPPFKMFFLLFTLSLLIETGLNIKGINRMEQQKVESEKIGKDLANQFFDDKDGQAETKGKKAEANEKKAKTEANKEKRALFDRAKAEVERIGNELDKWEESHPQFLELILLFLFSWPLWLLIRHCPAIPDLRFSECFVAMVYITNMLTIYGLIPAFLCVSLKMELILGLLTMLLIIIPVKQLSGYSYWKTMWRLVVALIPFIFMLMLLFIAGAIVLFVYALIKFS